MTDAIDTARLIGIFNTIAARLEADQARLCELDGVIGDADHGVTMNIGFSAVREALATIDPAACEPEQVFGAAARSFLGAVGASSGPLYATGFLRAAAAAKGKRTLDRDTMVAIVAAIAGGMQERGKAQPGDKTMIDAWLPAAKAATKAKDQGQNLETCMTAAADAAEAGAEATIAMRATLGRAARLGDRSIGHMDPGAASAATILRQIAAGCAGG